MYVIHMSQIILKYDRVNMVVYKFIFLLKDRKLVFL